MTSWPWRGDGVRTKQLTFEPSTICRLRCARRLMVWALTRRWTTSGAGRRFKQPSTALLLLAERSQLAAPGSRPWGAKASRRHVEAEHLCGLWGDRQLGLAMGAAWGG